MSTAHQPYYAILLTFVSQLVIFWACPSIAYSGYPYALSASDWSKYLNNRVRLSAIIPSLTQVYRFYPSRRNT